MEQRSAPFVERPVHSLLSEKNPARTKLLSKLLEVLKKVIIKTFSKQLF